MLFLGNQAIQKADTVWTTEAPSRITRKIRKDKKGNLLFAAYRDIIRYDGQSFSNLTKEKGFNSYNAYDVWEDRKGSIWIGSTTSGVFYFPTSAEQRIDRKIAEQFTTKNGLVHDRSMCFYEDRAGGIWIGTEGGISYYDGKSLPITFRNFIINDGLADSRVSTIMEDKTGKIWIGTRGVLSIYDPLAARESGDEMFTEITNKEGESFENVWSIIEDQKGNIWIGGEYGLWRYDGHSFALLSQLSIRSIYEDQKGKVWFTHGALNYQKAGFSYYDPKVLLESDPKSTPVFINGGLLFGITEDKDGDIWVGGLDGVFRYDGEAVSFFRAAVEKGK